MNNKNSYLKEIGSSNLDFRNFSYGIFLSEFKIQKNSKILEVGVGQGRHIISLKRLGFSNLYSTDISNFYKTFLEGIGIKFKKNNLEKDKLPYKENLFDVIIFSHVIEHLNDTKNVFEEFKRILKPDGILLIETPNYLKARNWFWDDPTHIRPYTKVTLKRLANTYNFEILKLENIGISNYLFKLISILKLFLIFPFKKKIEVNTKNTIKKINNIELSKLKIPFIIKFIELFSPNFLKGDNMLLIAKNKK